MKPLKKLPQLLREGKMIVISTTEAIGQLKPSDVKSIPDSDPSE